VSRKESVEHEWEAAPLSRSLFHWIGKIKDRIGVVPPLTLRNPGFDDAASKSVVGQFLEESENLQDVFERQELSPGQQTVLVRGMVFEYLYELMRGSEPIALLAVNAEAYPNEIIRASLYPIPVWRHPPRQRVRIVSLEMVDARAVMDVLAKLWDDVTGYLGRGAGYATIASQLVASIIFIDDEFKGETDRSLVMTEGSYTVRVESRQGRILREGFDDSKEPNRSNQVQGGGLQMK
jgi:hypothetical protein